MECFGISEADGTIYEGDVNSGFRPAIPPLVVPIHFPAFTLTSWTSKVGKYSLTLFREDFFDPITRVRRGRIFVLRSPSQPVTWTVYDPFRPRPQLNTMNREERVQLYERSCLSPLRTGVLSSANHIAIIGEEPFISFWKIVSIETSVHETPILTLKSYRSLGDLPELDQDCVPQELKTTLVEVLEKVANSNHRSGAVDVVDRCRDALSVVFGHLSGNRGDDLGHAIKKVQSLKGSPQLACYAANVVARLHSRGKPNEEFTHGTRPVSEEDAQLAVGCLGLVLKEVGWAKT